LPAAAAGTDLLAPSGDAAVLPLLTGSALTDTFVA